MLSQPRTSMFNGFEERLYLTGKITILRHTEFSIYFRSDRSNHRPFRNSIRKYVGTACNLHIPTLYQQKLTTRWVVRYRFSSDRNGTIRAIRSYSQIWARRRLQKPLSSLLTARPWYALNHSRMLDHCVHYVDTVTSV